MGWLWWGGVTLGEASAFSQAQFLKRNAANIPGSWGNEWLDTEWGSMQNTSYSLQGIPNIKTNTNKKEVCVNMRAKSQESMFWIIFYFSVYWFLLLKSNVYVL